MHIRIGCVKPSTAACWRAALAIGVLLLTPIISACGKSDKTAEGPPPGSTTIDGKPVPPEARNAGPLPPEEGTIPLPGQARTGGSGKKLPGR